MEPKNYFSLLLLPALLSLLSQQCHGLALKSHQPAHETGEIPNFKCSSKGFHPHPTSCSKFVACNGNSEQTATEMECGENVIGTQLHFNKAGVKVNGRKPLCVPPDMACCHCKPKKGEKRVPNGKVGANESRGNFAADFDEASTTYTDVPTTSTTLETSTTEEPTTSTTPETSTTEEPTTSTTPETSTTDTTTTDSTTDSWYIPSTTQEPPGSCDPLDCQLKGYCREYKECERQQDGSGWLVSRNCTKGLFWLPNSISGGTCVYFGNLPGSLQKEYRADPTCVHNCEWYQSRWDECSPRYIFREADILLPRSLEHRMSCPSPPAGELPLYWVQESLSCDLCYKAVDRWGYSCDCGLESTTRWWDQAGK